MGTDNTAAESAPTSGRTPGLDAGSSSSEQVVEFDAATEKRLVRKLDKRLVLLAFFCYMAAFLDRSNIGNAQTAGMGEDLGFDDAHYQWLLTIFYIPYITFEWMALMYKIIPPHIWGFVTVFTWAIASMMQAAAFNWQGLMACRFFLAVAEAGFGPGMPYLFSFYYNRRELGFRCGIFLSAAPLATTFAGALAYGITSGHFKIASWRLLFIIEAIPPLILAFVVFFVLPDSLGTAKFLTEEEKALARARCLHQSGDEDTSTAKGNRLGRIDFREVAAAVRTPQAWVQALMYLSCNVAFGSLPVFLPAILTGMGFTSVNAQGLTAPPYFLSFGICILSTWLGDRLQQRGILIGLFSLVGCLGYVLMATCRTVAVRYAGVFLAAGGVFPAIANILAWSLNNQRSDTKRGTGIAILNTVGQCGPLLGTRVFPVAEGPFYVKGMSVCAGFMFFNALLAFGLRTYFKYMNDKWDRQAISFRGRMDGKAAAVDPLSSTEKVGVLSNETQEKGEAGDPQKAARSEGAVGWDNSSEWRFAL